MYTKVSRSKKTILNMTSDGISQIVCILSNLIVPRLILTHYGSEYNGIVSSITELLNIISVLRLGVAGATRVELYKSLADNDVNRTSAIVKATNIFMRKIAFVLCGYIVVLMVVYPFLADVSYPWYTTATLIVVLAIGVFAEYFFGITYGTLLSADQRAYINTNIKTVATLLNIVLTYVLVINGCTIIQVKFFSSIVFAICPVFLSIYVPKHYNINKYVNADTTALKQRKHVMASSIANIVHENTDVVVLTVFTNQKVVSVYTVYRLIMNATKSALSVFTSSLEALFGNIWAKGEMELLKKNLRVYEYAVSVFIVVVFSCVCNLILPFISLYTKSVTDIEYIIPSYAFVVIIAQVAWTIRAPYQTVVQAAGKYKETKYGAFMEAAVNVIMSVILTYKIGMIGVAIGTLFANIIRSSQYSYYTFRYIVRVSWLQYWYRVAWIITSLLICTASNQFVMNLLKNGLNSWSSWFIGSFIMIAVSGLIVVILSLLFYKKDLLMVLNIFKKILGFEKQRNV